MKSDYNKPAREHLSELPGDWWERIFGKKDAGETPGDPCDNCQRITIPDREKSDEEGPDRR